MCKLAFWVLVDCLDSEPYWARSAAEELAKLGDKRAVEPLLARLNRQEASVRATIAQALGTLKDSRAIQPLVEALKEALKNDDDEVAEATAHALGQLGDEEAIESLIEALDSIWDYVQEAAIALGVIRDESAIEPLAAALSDEEWFVCLGAAQALVKIGGDKVVDLLVPAVGDNNYETRLAAIQALKILALRDSQKYAYTAGTFLERLDDEEWKVRDVAVKALGQLGYGPAAAKLKQIAESDSQEDVRKAAQAALAKIKQKV